MQTCLDREHEAAKILDNHKSTRQERELALQVFKHACLSCQNPLVKQLGLDNTLCEKKS